MKISYKKKASGFTLIEMIGVLAVIAILAALLIPKIFEAINNARINNATITVGTIKSAIADHYAKYGALNVDGTTTPATVLTLPDTTFAKVLLKEGFIDKDFAVKIGDGIPANNYVAIVAAQDNSAGPGATDARYNLDGDTVTTPQNDAQGSQVIHAVISDVAANDAWELSKRLDGDSLSAANATAVDLNGRVKYAAVVGGVTDVYIYLTHR